MSLKLPLKGIRSFQYGFIKPILGVGLLVFLIAQLDVTRIKQIFMSLQWNWFGLALLSSLLSNLLSALRWREITVRLGVSLSSRQALIAYFQGVAANTILPGGVLGGDLWRSIALVRAGAGKKFAGMTVLLDRIGGIWLLGLISALAGMVYCALPQSLLFTDRSELFALYGVGLFALVVLPLSIYFFYRAGFYALLSTSIHSLFVQVFAVLGFWSCLRALDTHVDLLEIFFLSTAVFLAAVIPAAIGGFGSREVASILVLGLLGISSEVSFSASVLYGLTATIQGILATFLWMKPAKL